MGTNDGDSLRRLTSNPQRLLRYGYFIVIDIYTDSVRATKLYVGD